MLLFAMKLKQSPEKVFYVFKEPPSEPLRNIKVWEVITSVLISLIIWLKAEIPLWLFLDLWTFKLL